MAKFLSSWASRLGLKEVLDQAKEIGLAARNSLRSRFLGPVVAPLGT